MQENFARARAALLRQGVCFPECWGRVAHYDLIKQLRTQDPALVEQMRRLCEGPHHTVLISAEGLANVPRAGVEYLRRVLPDARVEFVFYVRSWVDLLPSIWREVVKEGSSIRLPEFLLARLLNPERSGEINIGLLLAPFVQVFGLEALHLVSFDRVQVTHQDIYRHFIASFIKVGHLPAPVARRMNPSLSDEDTEIIRAMHAVHAVRHGRPPQANQARRLSGHYLRHKEELLSRTLRDAIAAHVQPVRLDEIFPELARLHQALYAAYGSRMVEPRPGNNLFVPRKRDIRYVNANWQLGRGIADELNALFDTLVEATASVEPSCADDAVPPGPAREWVQFIDQAEDRAQSQPGPVWFEKSLGLGGRGGDVATEGWSAPEPGFRWSDARRAVLRLPRPGPGEHAVSIWLRPYVVPGRLASQSVSVSVNGVPLGTTQVAKPGVLRFPLPAEASAADAIAIVLDLPDAARPCDTRDGATDTRLLSVAVRSVSLVGPVPSAPTR